MVPRGGEGPGGSGARRAGRGVGQDGDAGHRRDGTDGRGPDCDGGKVSMTPGQCLYPPGANTIQVVVISRNPVLVCVSIGVTIIARITAGTSTSTNSTVSTSVRGFVGGTVTNALRRAGLVDHRSGPPASNDSTLCRDRPMQCIPSASGPDPTNRPPPCPLQQEDHQMGINEYNITSRRLLPRHAHSIERWRRRQQGGRPTTA